MAGEAAGRTGRLAVAAHPLVIGALVALVVNDHVLKAWSGGVGGGVGVAARTVTGKASDVAGVLLLAVLAGVVLRHRRAAVVLVGLGFAALKLSPAVADLAVPVLGGRTRTDPWDLLALVALVPADRLLRRVDRRPATDLRPAWTSLRATLGLAVAVASVPAMTATSCGAHEGPSGLDTLAVRDDGTLLVAQSYDRRRYDDTAPEYAREVDVEPDRRIRLDRQVDWYASTDGGRTWARTELERAEVSRILGRPRATSACAGATCWRAVSPIRIEETGPAGEHAITTLGPTTREALDANRERGSCTDRFYVLGTEVVAVEGGAVATAGSYGVTLLRPGGRWESITVGPYAPPHDLPSAWPRHLRYSPAVGVVGLALALVLFTVHRPERRGVRWATVVLAVGAFLPVRVLTQLGDQGGRSPRESGLWLFWSTVFVVGLALVPLLLGWFWPDPSGRRRSELRGDRRGARPGPAPGASPPTDPRPPAAGP